jgi:hypothetical protein
MSDVCTVQSELKTHKIVCTNYPPLVLVRFYQASPLITSEPVTEKCLDVYSKCRGIASTLQTIVYEYHSTGSKQYEVVPFGR